MLNDHNDKFDSGEDSEYHFSDEEVSYELEGEEPQKPAAAETESGGPSSKEGFASKLTQSKRMMIAMGAFVALIFVIYKMISPGSNAPATDIAATTPASTAPMPANNVAANNAPALPTVPATAPQQPAPAVAAAPALPPPPALPEAPQQAQSTVTSTSPTLTVVTGASPASLEQPAQPAATAQPAAAVAQSVLQSVTASAAAANQAAAPALPALPSIVPVQSPTAVVNQTSTASPSYSSDSSVDAKIASMTASNERMMGQLQGQYTQQMTDFANQNKALQDQVQSLTSRVSVMENQLNQLIQALTRRNQNSSMASPAAAPVAAAESRTPDVKVAYNVQAIIPGRAWLKSDNGETLTVAEGDTIKDVGRVTKIDPYDGVVEINTGSKAVSLSYGAGG